MWMTLGIVAALSAALSLVTLVAMALDKRRARRGGWRIPESTLHLMELLGGWPGSLLASRWLRHKSVKPRYRIVRGLCIVVHLTAVVALIVALGNLS